jgi:hypothetical protein
MCPISHLHSPRFHKPPYDPGRSDFPSPVLVSALHAIYRIVVFPCRLRFKHWFAYTPRLHVSPISSLQEVTYALPSSVSGRTWPIWNHRVPRAPLPCMGTIRSRDDFQSHLERHYSSFIARTGSCVRPSPSHRLVFLVRRVFAGCYQSLLGVGPSRHYLCNPCVGAWTHTPPCLSGASTHFFPESNGLTPRETRSAHETVPAMRLPQGAVFRGCSHSVTSGSYTR